MARFVIAILCAALSACGVAAFADPYALDAPRTLQARPGERIEIEVTVTCPANWERGFDVTPTVDTITPAGSLTADDTIPPGARCEGSRAVPSTFVLTFHFLVAAHAPAGAVTVTFKENVQDSVEHVSTVVDIIDAGAAGAPAGLVAVPQTRSIDLAWTPDAAVQVWRLERATAGGPYEVAALLPAGSSGHADVGLAPDTAYAYRLVPRNAIGDGPAATVNARTLAEAAGNGTLVTAIAGDGSGRVSSAPAGIACPGDCTETLPQGTVVRLVAEPATGSIFQGWSGPADCADGSVTVVLELGCTATFARQPSGTRGWVDMGAALAGSFGESPVVAADPSGPVYVALLHVTGSGFRELLVHRFDGNAWSVLGGAALNGIGLVGSHGLVIDDQGRPVVAWTEPGAVRVVRFEGGVWNVLADNLRVGTGTTALVQLEQRSGSLVAAWFEIEAGSYRLVLKAWDGSNWRGGFGLDAPDMRAFRLALDQQGTPAVAVSRRPAGIQQPLAVWQAGVIQAQSVQWTALGATVDVAAGSQFLHEQIGFGIGFTRGQPGSPVVYGTRDDRYAYAKAFDGAGWVAAGRRNGVVDADGLVADIQPGSGERLAQIRPVRTTVPALMLHVAPQSPQQPRRIELLTLDSNDWVPWTDPLVVAQLASASSATVDATGAPVVVTVEGFGAGGSGRVRAYRWVP